MINMPSSLNKSLAALQGNIVEVLANDGPDENGIAAIVIRFQSGAVLSTHYWRLIQNNRAQFSSFDHGHKYGLPAPINAKEKIVSMLNGSTCLSILFDSETGDINVVFNNSTKLQIFNLTSYEVWEITFPDGTGEYSNYALALN